MELSTLDNQSDFLLTGKNVLNESVIDKYRLAGQVTQTGLKYVISLIHDSYHLGKINPPLTPAEICTLGDSYLYTALSTVYQKGDKAVAEKGIAYPVSLDVDDCSNGISPEIVDANGNGNRSSLNKPLVPGNIVKITLGAHIDGYTSLASHTIVIYPPPAAGSLNANGQLQPEGPLLGPKADAVCAAYIATEATVSLLGCALSPEKIPNNLRISNDKISGQMIRRVVDKVAESFGCTVVPGSEVRRIRRFLAGQAENIVAEKEFKGVIWAEAHQEYSLLQKSQKLSESSDALISADDYNQQNYSKLGVSDSSAIPTDDFVVQPGEVYSIDIKMASTSSFNKPGLVTLQHIDEYTGKNHNDNELIGKSDVYIRDFAVNYTLRLKNARSTLSKVEKISSVYPFKLAHLSENFPVQTSLPISEQKQVMEKIAKDVNKSRLGLSECVNNHLIVEKKVQIAKFLPLEVILNSFNETARASNTDLTLVHNTLPGFELPLPKLGITHLKLRSLLKKAEKIDVARELTTIALNNSKVEDNKPAEVLRLTGSTKYFPASWVHSNFKLLDEDIETLIKLGQDKRFGIKIKECQPMKLTGIKSN